MENNWSQSDMFPLIARAIEAAHGRQAGFVTHDGIVASLLADPEASSHVDAACASGEAGQSREWVAHNMVAWFSQRITVGDSAWSNRFERQRVNGKWAYRPREA